MSKTTHTPATPDVIGKALSARRSRRPQRMARQAAAPVEPPALAPDPEPAPKPQASEGWTLLPQVYDDGGISGGTLERPALQRLLADVAAGTIDNIVVYKVDRLTRSLLDFAKLVEAFDKAEVSFVSSRDRFRTSTTGTSGTLLAAAASHSS